MKNRALCPSLSLALLLAGCHGHSLPTEAGQKARAEHTAIMTSQREQLELVPPPSKTRYMAIHSFESWENPYLTVQPGMVELHVLTADTNTTSYGVGGMLRPVAARKQVLTVSLDKLAEAMASIPQSAWPYGRVVGIEEAHKTPASAEPTVRRNMEVAVGTLNDLGVVAYDLTEGSLR